jgi:lipopolysaccharide biosynthesis glycosyltransferase
LSHKGFASFSRAIQMEQQKQHLDLKDQKLLNLFLQQQEIFFVVHRDMHTNKKGF